MGEPKYKLKPGERFDLAVAVRQAMDVHVEPNDRAALARLFELDPQRDETWTEMFINATQEQLIGLAEYFKLELPESFSEQEPVELRPADAYSELVAAETALRDVIRLTVPAWTTDLNDDELQRLTDKRAEEDKKRDGVAVSQDLLDYTEVYQIQRIIEKNWPVVKPVLDDKKRTEVYLSIIFDIRNTISHSRPVVAAERLLLAGAAGQIRNQLARYRSSIDGAANHYSSIDSARDSLGIDGLASLSHSESALAAAPRLEVGDMVEFELQGTDPRGRDLTWTMFVAPSPIGSAYTMLHPRGSAMGSRTNMTWRISPSDVGERIEVIFQLTNASQYQRVASRDDLRVFYYKVNPPL